VANRVAGLCPDMFLWIQVRASRREIHDIETVGYLNRLALTDRNRKKAYIGGQMYLIDRTEVSDMMRRY